jgi:diaminopimelate decarboxylase
VTPSTLPAASDPAASDEYAIQGIAVSELAARFGTPLYVYDADTLIATYQKVRHLLHPAIDIFYSAKANPNISICAMFRSLGAGIEVSSLAELTTALRAGADPDHIIFLGPGKSAEELRTCCDAGIRAIVCESLGELAAIDELRPPASTEIILRVNPAFGAKGSRLSMGGKPRQFGIDEEQLHDAARAIADLRHIEIGGVHAYLGTRILASEDVVRNTQGILTMAAGLSETLAIPLRTVDIGGGFGVPYFEGEKELDLEAAAIGINEAVAEFLTSHPDTRLISELGRYLAGWAGTYVVRARYVKRSRGEWFVVADGGTNHHMAAVGIGSFVKRNFPVRSLTRYRAPADRAYNVTGPLCTPNDVVAKQTALPEIQPGDLIGVERSGAYGPSASPVLFLSHGHPAEVLVRDGVAHLIRHRDTVEDLLRPQHLISI